MPSPTVPPTAPSPANGKPKSNGDVRAWRAKNNLQKWAATVAIVVGVLGVAAAVSESRYQTEVEAVKVQGDNQAVHAAIQTTQQQMLEEIKEQRAEYRQDQQVQLVRDEKLNDVLRDIQITVGRIRRDR